ncbi:MAG TPA: hypothetical protein VLQ91_19920 [Draconibacterium sp.]|nr:hypothetical protein [Draconibacterium sp.]
MNEAHFHLVFNHLPIIIPIVGILVLLSGILLSSELMKRTAFFIFILGALGTIPAFATGEGAEEVIENIQGIDEKYIKIHEEAAETFAILSYLLGGIALIGLWANWKKMAFAKTLSLIVLVFAIAALFFAKQTGTTGGEIRHTELRADFNGTTTSSNKVDSDYEEEEDD